ncbi:hypothetical protein VTK73DRAFT_3990 [Phialemonium thermophilum]|uniref:Uncharacterized protein n=1 Tax=Phialemonium thermophilum TaxID=223376 RepID=A0ABR3WVX0_9PEZI
MLYHAVTTCTLFAICIAPLDTTYTWRYVHRGAPATARGTDEIHDAPSPYLGPHLVRSTSDCQLATGLHDPTSLSIPEIWYLSGDSWVGGATCCFCPLLAPLGAGQGIVAIARRYYLDPFRSLFFSHVYLLLSSRLLYRGFSGHHNAVACVSPFFPFLFFAAQPLRSFIPQLAWLLSFFLGIFILFPHFFLILVVSFERYNLDYYTSLLRWRPNSLCFLSSTLSSSILVAEAEITCFDRLRPPCGQQV